MAGGGTQKMDGDVISHAKPSGSPPQLAGAELIELEERWAACQTVGDRRDVLKDAITLWKAHAQPEATPRAMRGTREWREAIAHDPRSSRDVAKIYGVAFKTVCNYRLEFGHPTTV
jgi:hypothetical protein